MSFHSSQMNHKKITTITIIIITQIKIDMYHASLQKSKLCNVSVCFRFTEFKRSGRQQDAVNVTKY